MIHMCAWDYFHYGDGSVDVLPKKVGAFYPCLKSFLVVMLKRFTLIALIK